jgi:hypothetical protein
MSVRPRLSRPRLSRSRLSRSRLTLAAAGLFAALSGVGCACTPAVAERRVVVTLADELVGQPVVVSLHGATADELGLWKTYNVDEFFSPSNQLRAGIAKEGELVFDIERAERSKALEPTDPAWQRWKDQKAMDLVVIAYVPGFARAPDDKGDDPRRQVITLNRCRWANPSEPINISVKPTGVTVESQPLPEGH